MISSSDNIKMKMINLNMIVQLLKWILLKLIQKKKFKNKLIKTSKLNNYLNIIMCKNYYKKF